MKTEEAYRQYIISANNNANFESTILWLFFTLFVIAPLTLFTAYFIYYIIKNRK